jgi:hypothetical protein
MSKTTRHIELNISTEVAADNPSFTLEKVLSALAPMGEKTSIHTLDYMTRDSSWSGASVFLRFSGDPSEPFYEVGGEYEEGGEEVEAERLQYLRENGVCFRMKARAPIDGLKHYSSESAHEGFEVNAAFLATHGFPVDPAQFTATWHYEGDVSPEMYWLHINIESCKDIPMTKVSAKGHLSLDKYDADLLGISHDGVTITHPLRSADGTALVDPCIYGFAPSDRNGCEGMLSLSLEGGGYLLLSNETLFRDPDEEFLEPGYIGRYGEDNYLIAGCNYDHLPVQGQ